MTAPDGSWDRIAELMLDGYSIDYACEQGVTGGWSRQDVLDCVAFRGWNLDASGRVPFRDRPARTPARRRAPARPLPSLAPSCAEVLEHVPAAAAAIAKAAGHSLEIEPLADWERELVVPDVDPADWVWDAEARCYVLPAREPDLAASDEVANPATPPVDVLALGLAHRHPAVRAKAKRVQRAVDDLCSALARHRA